MASKSLTAPHRTLSNSLHRSPRPSLSSDSPAEGEYIVREDGEIITQRTSIITTRSIPHPSPEPKLEIPDTFGIYKCNTRKDHKYYKLADSKLGDAYYLVKRNWRQRSQDDLMMFEGKSLLQADGSLEGRDPIASTKFRDYCHDPIITLGTSAEEGKEPCKERLWTERFGTRHHFSISIPGPVEGEEESSKREKFVWKYSSGRTVKKFGCGLGMKLVRERTGEVVAEYAHVLFSRTKKGKMRFFSSGDILGNCFRMMAVMSVITFQEAMSRQRNPNRLACAAMVNW